VTAVTAFITLPNVTLNGTSSLPVLPNVTLTLLFNTFTATVNFKARPLRGPVHARSPTRATPAYPRAALVLYTGSCKARPALTASPPPPPPPPPAPPPQGDSPYASCSPGVTAALVDALSGLLSLPASAMGVTCSEVPQGSGRRHLAQDASSESCLPTIKADITFKASAVAQRATGRAPQQAGMPMAPPPAASSAAATAAAPHAR
jgi:hypothetical protein